MKKVFCDMCDKEIDKANPGYVGSHGMHPVSTALKFTPIPHVIPGADPDYGFVMTEPPAKAIRVELRVLRDPVWNPEGPEGDREDYEVDYGDYCWECLKGIVMCPRSSE